MCVPTIWNLIIPCMHGAFNPPPTPLVGHFIKGLLIKSHVTSEITLASSFDVMNIFEGMGNKVAFFLQGCKKGRVWFFMYLKCT